MKLFNLAKIIEGDQTFFRLSFVQQGNRMQSDFEVTVFPIILMVHLKCIKRFINLVILMQSDKDFDWS